MQHEISFQSPADFSFRHTVYGHGWCDLPPFELDDEKWRLRYVFPLADGPVAAEIREKGGRVVTGTPAKVRDRDGLIRSVKHILRLDEPLDEYYSLTGREERLDWIAVARAGRLLRSATVFEDMVKTLCTTNCSWALTKIMVRNLVESLGVPADGGGKAFPTAEAIAGQTESFFRTEIRAGYRSAYFLELAEAVASGRIEPEKWLTTDLSSPDLRKEIKKVKGFGDYAADNLLKLLGRYDGLALDSWLRAQFYRKHNREKPCPDKKIERFYGKFGDWKGLAIWCDMTERWFDGKL